MICHLFFLNLQHQVYPINAVNSAATENSNFTIVSGDPISIQLEETKTINTLKASNPDTARIEPSISTTEPISDMSTDNKETLTANDTNKLRDDESSKAISFESKDSKSEKLESNSTLHQVDLVEGSKKTKQSKNTISNQQQPMKQQPHIIRHHASSHTQNLQLIPSSPATQRPKLTQATIASTIRSSTQNIAIVSGDSLASTKSSMAINLTTSAAKDLTTKMTSAEETGAAENSKSNTYYVVTI